MVNYRKMYLHLFNEVTRALQILEEAQLAAEEMYLTANEQPVRLHRPEEDEGEAAVPEEGGK